MNAESETKVWYASKGVWGAVVVIIAMVAKLLGYEIGDADQAALVDGISNIAVAVGGLVALVGRVTASKPVALTKKTE